MMKRVKAALVGLLLLSSVGCAGQQWTQDVEKAVDPIAQKGLPFAGDALAELSKAFYQFCPVEKPRGPECLKARDVLNKMIDAYNKVNDPFLESN